jgi:hypothetical protein
MSRLAFSRAFSPANIRVILASLAIGFACVGALVASCTDGTTPDCTGDAAASCGPYPSDATSEGGATDSPNVSDVNAVDSPAVDTGSNDTDSGDVDAGDEDGGDASDGA